ncbi:carboxypeptidase regulatory-like domain-containing protein [Candidatus Electronema sp. JC]|uniref:NHL domain-containing protein n=1 Tax=Candidatus Electronema sp. JC TaxID=3401570 RepID=UPI003AA8968E
MKKKKPLLLAVLLFCFLLSSAWAGNSGSSLLRIFMMMQLGGKAAAPKVSLSAAPATIMLGHAATLSWTSTNADTVSMDNGIGAVDLNGSLSVQPTTTTTYTITAADAKGSATDSVTITVLQPPTVSLSADPASIAAGGNSTLTWTSTNADSVSIDNGIGTVDLNGTKSVSPTAKTTYTITATGAGGTATDTATVEVLPADAPAISISAASESIAAGSSTQLSWQSSNVDSVHIDNGIGAVAANNSRSVTPDHTTTYTITGSGAKGTVSAQVTVQVTGNPTEQPEGSYGEQYGDLVPPDATVAEYDAKRFALITGLVHDLQDAPLAEVRITVHGHPEYGTVRTDAEGRFSIPVEGGGTMTIAYKRAGFITSHRQVYVPWNDIAVAETVQMLAEDSAATQVTFDGNPATVVTHTSTLVTDEFGSRSATIVFQGDNKAYLVDEQGKDVQELTTITARATEFKTQESMPAVLPPNSAYTYCTELSVDGAARVRFDKPVTLWVDNFLGFKMVSGETVPVPVGYYDRDRGVWVPSENGIVVKLLDTDSDGVVDALDSDGDGQPNDLNSDGSFADEVIGLEDASRYAPGKEFWRAAVTHFTPWDCNWPYGPPEGATEPSGKGTPDIETPVDDANNGMCKANTDFINSYVKKRGRVFHEDIPIPGTGMTLHYASNRVDGYKQVITVPASGDTVPDSLKSIIVEVKLAGRTLTKTLEPLPNQQAQFVWDGLDYLGREAGAVEADVAIGFVYDAVYYSAGNFSNAFAQAGSDVTGIRARQEVTSWQRSQLPITAERDAGHGSIAEGWTLSDHHILGIGAEYLYKGDGSILERNSKIITTVAGTGVWADNIDNIPATEASLGYSTGVAVDQAGNIFIADSSKSSIYKVDTAGILHIIAGNGSYGSSDDNGDNGPATEASLYEPRGVAVDQIGNVFIADTYNNRIRKVDTDGIITTFAGNGSEGYNGDNILATEASLDHPTGVAIDQAGNIFIADSNNYRIRKVDIIVKAV